MDRRTFLQSSMALTAGAVIFHDYPTFAKAVKAKGTPRLRIGILSDIHITDEPSAETFRHALEYFRDRKVDGVLIAGDMADRGLEPQLKVVGDTWFSVFPDGKAPDGSKVEQLFIYGNHDACGDKWGRTRSKYDSDEALARDAIGLHLAESWERCFREPYEPIYMKEVKGYKFIGAHWCNDDYIDGLAEYMQAHDGELSGKKPFFYFQHPHPRNTCNGPWAWGMDDGRVTEILSHYPNCVAFSGHSHDPLTDERDLWQGAFTSIGTASLRYQCPIGARENSRVDGGPKEKSEMPELNCYDGRQGMVMTVFDDCMTFEKREFNYDEPLRENWIVPIGAKDAPMSFENRAKTAEIPQFAAGDKVTVTSGMGKDRQGDEHMQVTVHFPSVLKKTHGVRAFDYEVQVEGRYVDITKTYVTKRVYSPKCYLGEEHDGGEVTCVFAESELPLNFEVRFAVRPCECFGGKGEPVYSEWMAGPKLS